MVDNNTLVPPKVACKDGRLTTRPDKGKLKYPYPEPAFLGDLAHRTKTASGEVFKLALQPLSKSKGVNKIDAIKLKKNYGYMLNQLPNLDESKWENAAKAVLEHHFDCHTYCGKWCRRRHMPEAEKDEDRKRRGLYYRFKKRDASVYSKPSQIMAKYSTLERLKEVSQGLDTKVNESLNNTIVEMTMYCLKSQLPTVPVRHVIPNPLQLGAQAS
jgi:hypothetical protein